MKATWPKIKVYNFKNLSQVIQDISDCSSGRIVYVLLQLMPNLSYFIFNCLMINGLHYFLYLNIAFMLNLLSLVLVPVKFINHILQS